MPHVVVVGSFPSEFFTHLQAAGYTHTEHQTYSQYILKLSEAPAAVAVYGGDAGIGLESTEAILKLLKTDAILVLFSPSVTLLQCLKRAIGTVIDLPELKLEANVPLIVHKMRGIDHFHLVPGFSVGKDNDSTDSAQTRSVSSLLEYSVKLIGGSISFASDPGVRHSDSLTPPSGTVWCGYEPVTISNKSPAGDLDWHVDLYTYATNDTPKSNKCVVYTVMKHSGTKFYNKQATSALWTVADVSQVKDKNGLLSGELQTPQGPESDKHTYNVEFKKQVTLFKNNGKNDFQFDLSYSDHYTRDQWEQKSVAPNNHTFQFRLEPINGRPREELPIRGLSVWRSAVGKTQLEFSYFFALPDKPTEPIGEPVATKEIPLDITFSQP